MLETFKARLKAKYPKANLSQKRLDAIADRLHKKFPDLTEETDHDAKIDDYYPEEDIMDMAKQDDAIRTLKTKVKDATQQQQQGQGQQADDQQQQQQAPAEMPEWFKPFAQTIESMAADKQQQSIQQKLSANEKLKAVPTSFWNKRSLPKTDEEIEAFATEVETDFQAFEQERANQGLASTVKPVVPVQGTGTDKVSPEMQAYLAERNKTADTKTV